MSLKIGTKLGHTDFLFVFYNFCSTEAILMRLKYAVGHILKLLTPRRHPQYVHPTAQNLKILKIFFFLFCFLENKKLQNVPYACMYGVVVQGCQSSILSKSFETIIIETFEKNFMMNSLRKFWIFEKKVPSGTHF